MATKAQAKVRLKFQSERQLTSLLDALTPEAKAPVTRRANVKMEVDGFFLVLAVEADDTVALRATLNAYLRWINSIINVICSVDNVDVSPNF
jgi:tRNA threonylcarbamoyladenosine modification (KEOPS) complex  Pcc1 subunit